MKNRIEATLDEALMRGEVGAPPQLSRAMRYAVFPGGARVRPMLCLAVAHACGCEHIEMAEAAACALELLHCASLVHDDLPCFDNADQRRGKASVHRAFSEPIALLTGDALIVMAFETIARAGAEAPELLAPMTVLMAQAVGTPSGLVAGQAWESEESIPLDAYHRAKTASLFVAASTAGAIASRHDPAPWRMMGERLGAAYQVADDLLDALARPEEAGKPVRQDVTLGRPNAVDRLGVDGAVASLRKHVALAADAVPSCPGADALKSLVCQMANRLVPESLKKSAA